VINLSAVYREKDADFAERITRAGTDAEREHVLAAARDFSHRLPVAIELKVAHECRCIALISDAVVTPSPRAIDLTPSLRRKVGLP